MKHGSRKNVVIDGKLIAGVIPARGGSKGIPNKNLLKFCGKPLLAWSVEQALHSSSVNEVFVSSDSKDILDMAGVFGAIPVRRPSSIAGDKSPSESALMHCLGQMESQFGRIPDAVVFLQATSPLREAGDIDAAVKKFFAGKHDSLFSATQADDLCLWKQGETGPKSITYDYRSRGRRQDREPLYLENGSIYVFKPSLLKRKNNRLGGKIGIYVMKRWCAFEIDSPADVGICEYFFSRNCVKRDNKKETAR